MSNCMIWALSQILGVSVDELTNEIGHTGVEPTGRWPRGFHPQEFVEPALRRGHYMIVLETNPTMQAPDGTPIPVESGVPLIEKMRQRHDGMVLGLSDKGTRHAWASINGVLEDAIGRTLVRMDYFLVFARAISDSYEFT